MRISNNRSRRPSWAFPPFLGVCAAIVAFAVASVMPKTYKSESTLMFPAQANDNGLSGLKDLARGAGLGGGNADKGMSVALLGGELSSPQIAAGPNTAIAVMDSNLCRQKVIDKLSLTTKWDLPDHKALKRLEGTVSMSVDKNGLLAMEATEQDRQLARQILDAYIETLRQLSKDLSLNIATRNRKFLEERVTATRKRIAVLENKLLMETESDPNFIYSNAASDAVKGIVDLEQEQIKARVSYETAKTGLDFAMQKARAIVRAGTDLPMNSDLGRDARSRLADLEYEYSVARVQYGPDNVRYRQLKDQVEKAREQYRQEIARESKALDKGIAPEIIKLSADKEAYGVQVAGLTRALNEIKARMDAVPAAQMRRERLGQELKVMRSLLEYQSAELVKAEIAEDRDATAFQVIDAPDLPAEPFAPRRGFTAAMAAVAGLLIGVAFIVARTSSQPQPLDLEEVSRDVAVV